MRSAGGRHKPISLGLWRNFGGTSAFEDGRALIRRAVELANRKSRSSWRDFLLGLRERGLSGVEFVNPHSMALWTTLRLADKGAPPQP